MIEVNYFAIFLAAVASMMLGFVWYSEAFLGKPWMKMKGFTKKSLKEAQKGMGMYYALSFVLAMVQAYVLSHVMALSSEFYNYEPLQAGFTSAVFMWIGFVGPVQATATIFAKETKWNLWVIETGYQFVSLVIMGAVLGIVG